MAWWLSGIVLASFEIEFWWENSRPKKTLSPSIIRFILRHYPLLGKESAPKNKETCSIKRQVP